MLYKAATRFALVKTDSPKIYKAAYTIYGSQNGHFGPLEVNYMLSGSENGHPDALQGSYNPFGCQNGHFTRFAEVKTDSPQL